MWSSSKPALPTQVTATLGARLTLPASTSEEAVRGSGLQLRILRAPTLALLQDLVSRELRAHAMSQVADTKSARKRADAAANAATAMRVLAALDAGDFRGAVVLHATGFRLGIDLPPQLGGGIGECLVIPVKSRRKAVLEDAPELEVIEPSEDGADESTDEPQVPIAA
jgi:hypothetical protein